VPLHYRKETWGISRRLACKYGPTRRQHNYLATKRLSLLRSKRSLRFAKSTRNQITNLYYKNIYKSFIAITTQYRLHYSKRNKASYRYYGTKTELEKGPAPCNTLSQPHRETRAKVKVILVARPLLTPVAQKLCRCKHGVFTSRTCVHTRISVRIGIFWCCSWSI
jgi:hypothetical protein